MWSKTGKELVDLLSLSKTKAGTSNSYCCHYWIAVNKQQHPLPV